MLWQCGKVVFPSKHQLVNELLLAFVTKTVENFVNPILINCITYTAAFDLWMSWSSNDIFALVISFINSLWQPCHVTIIESIMGITMAKQMKDLFGSFGLLNKVIAFVKDKGTNLKIMTTTLKSIVSCDIGSSNSISWNLLGPCYVKNSPVCHRWQ